MDDIKGPYIVWRNYGYEGWKPESYSTIEEAVKNGPNYCNDPFVITKAPVEYTIVETFTVTEK